MEPRSIALLAAILLPNATASAPYAAYVQPAAPHSSEPPSVLRGAISGLPLCRASVRELLQAPVGLSPLAPAAPAAPAPAPRACANARNATDVPTYCVRSHGTDRDGSGIAAT